MEMHDRCNRKGKNPSFSSTLLDEIYRSMDDEAEEQSGDLKFCEETTAKKLGRKMEKFCEGMEEEAVKSLTRPCLIEKWMEKQVSEKVVGDGRRHCREFQSKSLNNLDYDHYLDQDGVLFSSTSLSSDSSFGGFSSSDSESVHTTNSFEVSCFAPPWLKTIRTCVHSRPEKPEKKQRALSNEHREFRLFGDYLSYRDTDKNPDYKENMNKSESRALKICSQLRKVKDPISQGGRVASFLNSLFTAGTARKTKNASLSGTSTTCSSSSSFSRSCLSIHSPSVREGVRNVGDKRTVRFCPVSVIIDEDCRPCGHKSSWDENESTLMASPATVSRGDEEDDTESCSSSDLFELDHHSFLELPVYETTRFNTNRVLATGLSL